MLAIYAIPAGVPRLERVTVDDTLKDAFGGVRGELVQFIGIGASMMPRVGALARNVESVFLTSDGAHFINPLVFEQLIINANDPLRIAERVLALSRWLGGPDNASISAFRLSEVAKHLKWSASSALAKLWSGTAQLQLAYAPQELYSPIQTQKYATNPKNKPTPTIQSPQPVRDKRKSKKHRKRGEAAQLEIKIQPDDSDDASDS